MTVLEKPEGTVLEVTDDELLEFESECVAKGALTVLDAIGDYVTDHIVKFSLSTENDRVHGAVKMLTSIRELVIALTELYKHPEREEQILEEALSRRTTTV